MSQRCYRPGEQPQSTPVRKRELFDYERTLARLGGDPSLFDEIVALFLEDSPQLLTAARSGLASGDLSSLERAAHSLKGLSVNFDATALSSAAVAVEHHARDGDRERAASCFEEMERELGRLQAALRQFQARDNCDRATD